MRGLGAAVASAAVILLSGAGGAYAADLNALPVKALPPAGPATCASIVDFFTTACLVQAYGVRFYGTIDVGYGYQSNGEPFSKMQPSGYNYIPQKQNFGGRWSGMPQMLGNSNIGLQVNESLGLGWSFVGQIEAVFDPYSLQLSSNQQALRNDIGRTLGTAMTASDGALNGTPYNSLGYFGFSNDTWGAITFLRQGTLYRDMFFTYDPIAGSNAFSYIGGSGNLSGGGNTENSRQTTAIKYRVNIGNFRLGLFGQVGDYDEGNSAKGQFQGEIGADFKVGPGILSVDAAGGYAKDTVNEGFALASGNTLASGFGNPNALITGVTATISNNTSALVGARYDWDRLKLYAGYEWIQLAAPSDVPTSFTDVSGQQFIAGSSIFNVVGNAYGIPGVTKDKILQLAWFGGRYSVTDSLEVAAAYYHTDQNQYTIASSTIAGCAANSFSSGQCAGTQDAASILIDWKFAPKWDTYIGALYAQYNGGEASGFLARNFWVTGAGLRFRW
jgi:predicted porin